MYGTKEQILLAVEVVHSHYKSRVVDPYSFFPDPDPEYDVGDQYGSGSRSGSNTDPGL